MIPRAAWRAAVCGLSLALTAGSEATATFVGDYFFPSTLATTVPTAADFLNPPNVMVPPATATSRQVDIPTTYSKLITHDWAVIVTETFRTLEQASGTRSGFDNLVLGTQYQLYTNAQHQFVLTIGGTAAIGGTGSPNICSSFSTLSPTVYMGKGFGDLPDSMAWLRPFGFTAQVDVAVPTRSTSSSAVVLPTTATAWTTLSQVLPASLPAPGVVVNPNLLQWSFALEYSLTSLYQSERGSRYAGGWIPIVEFALQTPLNGPTAGQTTGTVNPGVIWVGQYLQVAVEAILPINTTSGSDIGVRAQAHLYFSEIFPDTIGKPIFGN